VTTDYKGVFYEQSKTNRINPITDGGAGRRAGGRGAEPVGEIPAAQIALNIILNERGA
jgi:hypothetical protein